MGVHFLKKRSRKSGLPPGSLIHIGERLREKAKISVIKYDEETFEVKDDVKPTSLGELKTFKGISWIDVEGLHDIPILEEIGRSFGLHPLVLEDIVNTDQRPKMEEYDDYIYIVLKMLCYDETKHEVVADQVSIVFSENFVITLQEGELDVFDSIRRRLRDPHGRTKIMSTDFLAYSIIDAIVDNYFFIMEKFGEGMEKLEDELVEKPTNATLSKIHKLKRDILFLRKAIWPIRELVGLFERSKSKLVSAGLGMYLRDVHDHAIYLVDTMETFRDMLSGMLDIYLSSVNNRMNEIIKVLTIIATLFMPLTFVAGIYGMNFEYMPELKMRHGYPMVLGLMAAIALVMFTYFRKKRWL